MNASTIFLIGIVLVLMIIFAQTIKILKENERGVIFRLEKFLSVVGPGLILTVPFIDQMKKIDLNEKFPGWYDINEKDLIEKIKREIITQ